MGGGDVIGGCEVRRRGVCHPAQERLALLLTLCERIVITDLERRQARSRWQRTYPVRQLVWLGRAAAWTFWGRCPRLAERYDERHGEPRIRRGRRARARQRREREALLRLWPGAVTMLELGSLVARLRDDTRVFGPLDVELARLRGEWDAE